MYSHQASDSQQSHHAARAALVQRRKLTSHAAPLQDNRSSPVSQLQANVLQLAGGANAYKAGKGAYWHIHYDHVKFGGLAETRINFDRRKRNQVLRQMHKMRNVPPQSKEGAQTYRACREYILKNGV
ncbi:hypothetical protein [Vibrio sp. 10N]|uniref:hypothetical protein n=1 Tax=Vibrio sp. 10N TaxID=3058938 RepID=UPI002812E34D|nr:hypothetical protein VB10N_22540 [Vibrio sp. 10N]